MLRWKLTSRAARWPKSVELAPQPPPPSASAETIVVTWINHATFLLQTSRGNFLTDPVFSERVSPVSWAGPKRVHRPGLAFEALPKIDGVLLSHDHFDHCDLPTLRRLAATHAPQMVAPLGHRELLQGAGLTRVVELDWWEAHDWDSGSTTTLTPARHWCRRRIGGTNQRLWGGFFLQTKTRALDFTGDSGYDPGLFPMIKQRLGSPDLALIPIGAYEPRWFMRSAHMNPAEAVQVHCDLGAKTSVAMHWGTWQLTDEAREAPPRALAQALADAQVAASTFRILAPGESLIA